MASRTTAGRCRTRRISISRLGLLATLFVATSVCAQTTYYIDPTAPPGGDGTIGNPFDRIGFGITEAIDGDTISLAPGTYFEVVPFSGKAITIVGQGDPFDDLVPHATIDGAFSQTNLIRIESGEGPDSVLDNVEVTGGLDLGIGGAGIFIIDSSPTITNCVIDNCMAQNAGGGIYVEEGAPLISHCWIHDCALVDPGFGISGEGAGIFGLACNAIITDCQVFNNGELYGNEGGGIYMTSDSIALIDRNIIANNASSFGGGIMLTDGSAATVSNNLIVANSVNGLTGFAGAIAGDGGGIYCRASNANIVNNTLSLNVATSLDPGSDPGSGAGIMLWDSDALVANNIFWNDTSDDASEIAVNGGMPDVQHCDVEGGFAGTGNLDVDPDFIDPVGSPPDFHLQTTSPLIDAGASLGISDEFDFDMDNRELCDGIDIGFDEVVDCGGPVGVEFLRGDTNQDGDYDIADQVFTLSALFSAGSPQPACADSADQNDDGNVDISDAIYGLAALFTVGAPFPPTPGTVDCGVDPTDDLLDCAVFGACPGLPD